MKDEKINVAIGFATGRKNFQRVLRNYIFNWMESNLVSNENVGLNLFVAYDLDYRGTKKTDYTAINPEIAQWIDSKHFIGKNEVEETKQDLINKEIVSPEEASFFLRKDIPPNEISFCIPRSKIKWITCSFWMTTEYPMAVTKNGDTALWSGQHVLETHLRNIKNADITYGYHCGYISPIPFIEFSDVLTEETFRRFVQAISNDIVTWETIKKVMQNGGVTYADVGVLKTREVLEVPEINHAKFISGSNLCINLRDTSRVSPSLIRRAPGGKILF